MSLEVCVAFTPPFNRMQMYREYIEEELYRVQRELYYGRMTMTHEDAKFMMEGFEKTLNGSNDNIYRMSQLGRPTCQLWMQKNKKPAEPEEPHLTYNRFVFGDILEQYVMFLLGKSDIQVVDTQVSVSVDIDGRTIPGTADVVLKINKEMGLWDVKTASDASFKNYQRLGFSGLVENDPFGYILQGFLYGKGISTIYEAPFCGWIVINKNSGAICVVEVQNYKDWEGIALKTASEKIRYLESDEKFKREYTDEEETYNKSLTGNKRLGFTCAYCDYKNSCWKGLVKHRTAFSVSKDAPMKWYTSLKKYKEYNPTKKAWEIKERK